METFILLLKGGKVYFPRLNKLCVEMVHFLAILQGPKGDFSLYESMKIVSFRY